jgi:hypothetical protein
MRRDVVNIQKNSGALNEQGGRRMTSYAATAAHPAEFAADLILSPDQVADASHPAILRAIEDILRDGDNGPNFSNFYSHQSFGNISNGHR